MPAPTNKSQLIQTYAAERLKWEELWDEVGPERMETSGVAGEWSVKDIVAHVNTWEGRVLAWLEAAAQGCAPVPAPWPTNLDEDAINAWIWKANRGRRLEDVLDESRQTGRRVQEVLSAIAEPDMTGPGRFWWLSGGSLLTAIPGNSFEHYRDHAETIRAWLMARQLSVG